MLSCMEPLNNETEPTPARHILPAHCCKRLVKEVKEDNLFCVMTTEPFTTNKITPKIYIQSDGGHGGMTDISFCPFCGRQIKLFEWVGEEWVCPR